MKLMTQEQIIELLPGDEIAAREIPWTLQNSVPGADGFWLSEGIKNGDYQMTTVQIDKVPRYRLFWHKNRQHMLVFNAVFAIEPKDDFPALVKAARQLAKQNGCRGIEFCTKRRGLVEKLLRHGGEIVGVTCYLE
jgi:hypothetical protein